MRGPETGVVRSLNRKTGASGNVSLLYSEISNYENGRCECARAHIEVKTGGTAGQARVYRENKWDKSGTKAGRIRDKVGRLRVERRFSTRSRVESRELRVRQE